MLVSQLGDQVYGLALPWLVYNLTGSALAMGTMFAVEQLPVLLNPLMGTLIDRLNRRRLLLFADLVRAALVGLVPLLWYTHHLALWQLYVLGLVLTSLGLAYNVTTFAITPLVVPDADVPLLNSIFMGSWSVSMTIGPAVAGLLIGLVGAPLAMLGDAVSFLATALALVWFRPGKAPRRPGQAEAGLLAETWQGVRYYVSHPVLLPLGLFMMLANLGYTLFMSQLIFHYRHDLNLGAGTTGALFAVFGLAATLGNLAAPRVMSRLHWNKILLWARGISSLTMAGHAFTRGPLAMGATVFATGATDALTGPVSNTLRQRIIPREMLGRVQATHLLFCFCANPVGALLSGPLTQAWGATLTLATGGAILLSSLLVLPLSPLGRLEFGETAPAAPAAK